ncbi:hypothetical protein [Aquibaculum sediminis]|uniref:hypothetical protein n=1 Tax=Aquibaculum sediminis TaxID=3231907 RepID=UPI0034532184
MRKKAFFTAGVFASFAFLGADDVGAQKMEAAGIAGSNDHVYYWMSDGTVSSGTTLKHSIYRASQKVGYLPGPTLIAAAIAKSDDHVYYWWSDGTVSSGTSTEPTHYREPEVFSAPGGKTLQAAGIASDDHVYYWWTDGTVSAGTSTDPSQHREAATFNVPASKTLQAAAIAGDDHVYYWWTDGTVSSGTSTDPTRHRGYYGDLVAFGWCYKLQWTARKLTIHPIVFNDASTTWRSGGEGKYWVKVVIGSEHVQSTAQGLPIRADLQIPPNQFAPLFPGLEVELRSPPTAYSSVGSWTFEHPDDMVRENNEYISTWNNLRDTDFVSNGKASGQACSF